MPGLNQILILINIRRNEYMKTRLKGDTTVVIGGARLSYPAIFEPKGFEGQEPKYSASLIISKNDKETIKIIETAIENAKKQGLETLWNNKLPSGFRQPLRDGDEDRPDDEAYANSYFLNASSKNAPQVVGKKRDISSGRPIPLGEEDVYAGCYVNVSVNFYPYSNISKGVGAGLNNIQKEADGDPFSGRSSAADDFDFEDVDSDDDFLD